MNSTTIDDEKTTVRMRIEGKLMLFINSTYSAGIGEWGWFRVSDKMSVENDD